VHRDKNENGKNNRIRSQNQNQNPKQKTTQHLRKQNNSHRIIQNTLPKNHGIQFRVHLHLMEDGENGDWVRGREDRAKDQTVQERHVHVVETCENNKIE
jgi:hypothetical protein